jgi:hypothetical protein
MHPDPANGRPWSDPTSGSAQPLPSYDFPGGYPPPAGYGQPQPAPGSAPAAEGYAPPPPYQQTPYQEP